MANIKIRVEGKSTIVGTFIPVGSRNEPDDIKGISHFLEHMLFKGTKTRNMTEIKQAIDKYGAVFNAWTSEEHTFFYVVISNKYVSEARKIIDDMVENSIFPAEELEKEKQVVLQELEMYQDNPQSAVFELAQSKIFADGSNLHIPIIGTRESVTGITRDVLIEYYNKYYKNAIKLEIGGSAEEARNRVYITSRFAQEPITYDKKDVIEYRNDISQANMVLTGLFYINTMKERLIMDLFSSVINGFCGRFFEVIREQNNLVYNTTLYMQEHSCGTVQYCGFAGLKPEKVQFAKKLMLEQLTKTVSKEELDFARGKLLGGHELSIDKPSNIARILIDCSLSNLDYNVYLRDYEKSINDISLEEVNSFIKRINFNNSKLVAILPRKKK